MSKGKLFQSVGAATLKAREVEDNFVRGYDYHIDLCDLPPCDTLYINVKLPSKV